jgi:hypothetical protein
MDMLKPILAALLLTAATPAISAATMDSNPAPAAQAETKTAEIKMDDLMSTFAKMFDTSNLPEPEPKRLELAKATISKMLPDGAYAKMMDGMFEKMLTPLIDIIPALTNEQIVAATGASAENVAALTVEKKAAVTQIIDPQHKDRAKQMVEIMTPMISEAMAVIEPAMRNGLSRAYARKFTETQLTTINSFFATPTGATFARESFALQADPEVLQATFKAIPDILASFMRDETKFKAKIEALPKQRELKDLSDTEMQQLAGLLSVDVATLEAHRTIDPYADETGEEPWYAEDAWAAAERKKVKALEAKYDAAYARSEAAYKQSTSAYEVYENAWQVAVDAARKRMLAEGWTPPPAEPETTK